MNERANTEQHGENKSSPSLTFWCAARCPKTIANENWKNICFNLSFVPRINNNNNNFCEANGKTGPALELSNRAVRLLCSFCLADIFISIRSIPLHIESQWIGECWWREESSWSRKKEKTIIDDDENIERMRKKVNKTGYTYTLRNGECQTALFRFSSIQNCHENEASLCYSVPVLVFMNVGRLLLDSI